MGVAIPQIITGDSAAGAAQLGYSVKFNSRGQYSQQFATEYSTNDGCDLAFTPSSNGNRRTWTYSTWVKRSKINDSQQSNQNTFMGIFSHVAAGAATYQTLVFDDGNDNLSVWISGTGGGGSVTAKSNAQYRDVNGWYNIVWVSDTTNATAADRWKFYINGVDLADATKGGGFATNNIASISQDHDGFINSSSYEMTIGSQRDYNTDNGRFFDGYMSQCVMVDGQALDASYFGFEDPMTGTWRPKKFNIEDCPTADFGTNGFYLPMDGSGPIGKDQSGKGNDWTPRGFEGTAPMNMAEGGLPMLETSTGTNVQYKGYAATRWSENAVFSNDSRGMPVDTRGYVGYAVTVANPTGSQNRYYIGISTDNDSSIGGEEAPLLRLARGQTVNFFQSDSTNTNHPLKIGTTAEASSAASGYDMSGFAHTVGTPGTQRQARFTITIPNDAPDTLYYSCSAHTGMGGTISVYTDPVVADPYAAKCRVAMPLSASRQDRACGIAVTAEYKEVSDNGGINVGLRSCHGGLYGQAGQSWISLGQYLSRPSSNDYDMGTAPFTVEIWCWPSSCKTAGQYKRAWEFGSSNSDNICLSAETINNGISWSVRKDDALKLSSATQTGTGSTCHVVLKKWTHVAVVREGTGSNETKLYVDGIQASSCTLSDDLDFSDDTLRIGANNADASNSSWNGYLNDFRFYKGVAKYTKNFAVPSFTNGSFVKDTPYALPAGGPARSPKYGHGSIVTGKAKNGYNSIQIPGFGLTASEDYTVEFYYWWPGIDRGVIFTQDDGSNVKINVATHRDGYFYNSKWNGTTGPGSPNSGSMLANSWNHICFQYWNEHQSMIFTINGGEQKYTNVGATWEGPGSGDGLGLGNSGIEQSTETANGCISNFRVVKGRRVYACDQGVAGFQPPSGPLENITGTYLLCAKDPTDPLAYEVAPAVPTLTITANGNTSAQSTAPTGLSGSARFDGNGDNLSLSSNNRFFFGYGDFTIECWFYADTAANYPYIIDFRSSGSDTGTGTNKPILYLNTNNKLQYWVNGSTRIESDSTVIDAWTHVAIVRCGLTHTMYVNGVAEGPIWEADVNYTSSSMAVTIGQRQGTSGQSLDGWISNLRVTKTAVYKEGFTPGQQDLESIPGTVLLCCKSSSSATAQDAPWPLYKMGQVYSTENNPFDDEYDLRSGRESGYATLNSLPGTSDGYVYLSNGNLTYYSAPSGGNNAISLSNLQIPPKSGKWYCEYRQTYGAYPEPGLALVEELEENKAYDNYMGATSYLWMWYNGSRYNTNTTMSYGRGSTPGDTSSGILGMGFDSDTGQLNMYWNGVDQGVMAVGLRTDTGGHYAFGCGANNQMATFNFGQQPFQSPVPYGYKALCSSNLYDVGITTMRNSDINPENHIGIVTYAGTGAARGVTGVGFQPDLVWVKTRTGTHYHMLSDSVRGVHKAIYSNSNNSEQDDSTKLTSFDVDGFSMGTDTDGNASGQDFVAWCWRAGGNKGTWNVDGVGYDTVAKAGLDGGSIDPTGASVNTKSGFGIYKYEGNGSSPSTIAHGLTNKPAFIMIKRLDGYSGTSNLGDWMVGCDSMVDNAAPNNNWEYYLVLNKSQAKASDFSPFNVTAPNASTFSITNSVRVNNSGDDYVAYVWCNMPGLCKVGMYEGSGVIADGPFIYTGFKPALVITKRLDTANDWNMQDIVRSPFNEMDGEVLQANESKAESTIGTGYQRDHLSNGFRLRSNGTETNGGSGAEYLYIAWSSAALCNQYGGISNAH